MHDKQSGGNFMKIKLLCALLATVLILGTTACQKNSGGEIIVLNHYYSDVTKKTNPVVKAIAKASNAAIQRFVGLCTTVAT